MFRSKSMLLSSIQSRELLLVIFCISQGSVVTHLRYGGKYDTSLAANLLLSPTVKKQLKSANFSQSYERISYGTFLIMPSIWSFIPSTRSFCPRSSQSCHTSSAGASGGRGRQGGGTANIGSTQIFTGQPNSIVDFVGGPE